jgi:hypothetical protein
MAPTEGALDMLLWGVAVAVDKRVGIDNDFGVYEEALAADGCYAHRCMGDICCRSVPRLNPNDGDLYI